MRYSEFNVKIYYRYGAASDQKQELIGHSHNRTKVGHGVLFTKETLTVACLVAQSRQLPI